jgi:hypothetical protein
MDRIQLTNATASRPSGTQFRVTFYARKLPEATSAFIGFIGVLFFPNAPIFAGSESAMFVKIGDEKQVVRAPRSWVVEGDGMEITLMDTTCETQSFEMLTLFTTVDRSSLKTSIL